MSTTKMYPYATVNDIKLYLRDKLSDADLTTANINYYYSSACVKVHQDFSRVYITPFINEIDGLYKTLPQDTRIAIRDLCVYYTAYLMLKIYFGNNDDINNASEYADTLMLDLYNKNKSTYMGMNADGINKAIPLQGLALNPNASFRSVAGLPSSKTGIVGANAPNNAHLVKNKLTDLSKSMWNGRTWRRWK